MNLQAISMLLLQCCHSDYLQALSMLLLQCCHSNYLQAISMLLLQCCHSDYLQAISMLLLQCCHSDYKLVHACREMYELAKKENALIFLDDCHATGFLGNSGR